jgi:15-cis-phytoene synthase/lycopene beta-cyclase
VRNKIWTYPEDAVSGYTFFSIPIEEVFFFIIQTYNTSMIYTVITRRLVLASYLQKPSRALQILGGFILGSAALGGLTAFIIGDKYTYMGLMIAWACSWLLFQW